MSMSIWSFRLGRLWDPETGDIDSVSWLSEMDTIGERSAVLVWTNGLRGFGCGVNGGMLEEWAFRDSRRLVEDALSYLHSIFHTKTYVFHNYEHESKVHNVKCLC
ncbi:hypothetical protein BofuT4_P129130.1 [Botrytis cinerea T4]|uniref:Uncharacterized protein n=1 Tax=Botryotinia fuckeliana (strain T4) TaxID=999810 RepID=G2YRG5_BOTF4|nr:hypothetical protein BofuT4_P129130.1 [Botrytis cinerea T4]